ncbi:lipoyl(octanoyl) transferase LipB [Buchnera aphidicola (Hormaphis cornu)]|nr:lipoyl(octanoyl) transferase LipB [Buchnera aphidicola (Hormaphis cornu)]
MDNKKIIIKDLGLKNWNEVAYSMYQFTSLRTSISSDEIWFVQHYPVFTLGKSVQQKNIYISNTIPLFFSNRGGKITYHGPGQQLIYFLIDIKRLNMNIKTFVVLLEQIIIETLNFLGIIGISKKGFPGIYVNDRKICSLGLCIKNGCSLHGLALNVDMDLSPFDLINPCGINDLIMTQIKCFNSNVSKKKIKKILIEKCLKLFSSYYV